VSAVHSGGSGGGGGGAAAAAAASAVEAAATTYSTTVGGKNYSGSVQESDGVYEASIPNLPGASASGSSAELAEANLDNLISILA
jgi:alanine dehydrogenase